MLTLDAIEMSYPAGRVSGGGTLGEVHLVAKQPGISQLFGSLNSRLKGLLGPASRVIKKNKKRDKPTGSDSSREHTCTACGLRRKYLKSSQGRIVAVWCEGGESKSLQGYLAHKKPPPPQDHRRALG